MTWLWLTNFLKQEEMLQLVLIFVQKNNFIQKEKVHTKAMSLQKAMKYLVWRWQNWTMAAKYDRTRCTKGLLEKNFLCDQRVFLWTYSWNWATDKTSKSRMFLSMYYLLEKQPPTTCLAICVSKVLDNTLITLSCRK